MQIYLSGITPKRKRIKACVALIGVYEYTHLTRWLAGGSSYFRHWSGSKMGIWLWNININIAWNDFPKALSLRWKTCNYDFFANERPLVCVFVCIFHRMFIHREKRNREKQICKLFTWASSFFYLLNSAQRGESRKCRCYDDWNNWKRCLEKKIWGNYYRCFFTCKGQHFVFRAPRYRWVNKQRIGSSTNLWDWRGYSLVWAFERAD